MQLKGQKNISIRPESFSHTSNKSVEKNFMTDNKILLRELNSYRELEKQLGGITLKELVQVFQDDIVHYDESPIGIHILSQEDFKYYTDLMEEKSRWKYNQMELEYYKELEKQLSKYKTNIGEVVQEFLNKGRGKED